MKLSKLVVAGAIVLTPVMGSTAESGDWLLRAGVTTVNPDDSSGNVIEPGCGSWCR